jgi:hypothetical protein
MGRIVGPAYLQVIRQSDSFPDWLWTLHFWVLPFTGATSSIAMEQGSRVGLSGAFCFAIVSSSRVDSISEPTRIQRSQVLRVEWPLRPLQLCHRLTVFLFATPQNHLSGQSVQRSYVLRGKLYS